MPSSTPNFNYTLPTPFGDANVWGTELNNNISAQDTYLNSAANTFIGSAAPSVPALAAGRLWINNTGSTWPLSVYDGASWLTIGTINPTAHTWLAVGSGINVQLFTANGTYTPSVGMSQCIIEVVGGAGAGGGTQATIANQYAAGGGGGGGGYSRQVFTAATIGASQAVTVGAGGTGVAGANGNAGAVSSVGTLITANGGAGGQLGGANAVSDPGGVGGAATAAQFAIPGEAGDNSIVIFNSPYLSGWTGKGGASFYGEGAARLNCNTNGTSVGVAGNNYGGGGSGGCAIASSAAQTGGAGAPGVVIITEYV